jgi:hypothetical protein
MDVGAFVQENKRWLVGCAIGAVVWMIASSVIDSIYDYRVSTPKGALSEAYGQAELDAAQSENEQLDAELQRLKRELAFVVAPKYSQWAGPVDQHVFLRGRDLKRAVVDAASDRDVVVEESRVAWEPDADHNAVLFGLDMMDEIQQRLFAAHDHQKQLDEDAMGLVEIDSIKLESTRSTRSRVRSNRGGIDIADWVAQQSVTLQFQADEPTLATFLESCRADNRTLVLDRLDITKPTRPGDPSIVKATLSGISFLK